MTTLHEIEDAVSKLPPHELVQFAHWFGRFEMKSDVAETNVKDNIAFAELLKSAPKVDVEIDRDNSFSRAVEL